MQLTHVIKGPLITEKGTVLRESLNQYLFEVDARANKYQIQQAVEKAFAVHVLQVHTLNVRGKIKRVGKSVGKRSNFKKAYVTLREGEKIDFFEGV